jgi:Zn-dependent metalloprotease
LRVTRSESTGRVRFIGRRDGRAITTQASGKRAGSPDAAATSFVRRYGGLLGSRKPDGDLRELRATRGASGGASVRFQQLAGGVPVIGGELVVTLDSTNRVVSASGELSPAAAASKPRVPAEFAARTAASRIGQLYSADPRSLTSSEPVLGVFDPQVLGIPDGSHSTTVVWQLTVQGRSGNDEFSEQVYVDAATGTVVFHFDTDQHSRQRRICDRGGKRTASDVCRTPYTLIEGRSTAKASSEALSAYLYAGDTYDYYKSRFGRDGLDGKGMPLRMTVRYCPTVPDNESPSFFPCPYDNAYWNGAQVVFGAGLANADDVVGHEFTHGVTQFEANLFSLYQAGAINESMSDIFGELIDQYNASVRTRGRDTTGAGGSVDYRWLIGEDAPVGTAFDGGYNVQRSMRDPSALKEPDRMRSGYYSAENEWSKVWDNGGVHANAGVGNKTAYLIAVGGTFNGQNIPAENALGNEKLAQLYYRALTSHLTSAADYADLADALRQSCAELLSEGPITAAGTTLTFTSTDCATVETAVTATQLDEQPIVRTRRQSGKPLQQLDVTAPEAVVCDAGEQPSYLFYDDLEHPGVGNWSLSRRIGGRTWTYPQNPNPFGVEFTFAKSGTTHMFADDPDFASDFAITTRTEVVPTASTYLRIDHAHLFDFDYDSGLGVDSGVVEVSTDGGHTFDRIAPVGGEPYGTVAGSSAGNDSPLHGSAFVGDSHGYVASRFFLGGYAGKGLRIRFRLGSDSRFGNFGWFVDDVRVYDCSTANAAPAAPQAPRILSVTPAEDGLGVVWSASPAPAGTLGYVITATAPGHEATLEVRAGLSGSTIRGLSSKQSYAVTVRALSVLGDAVSDPSAATTPVDTRPPSHPSAVTLRPGIGTAVVGWSTDPSSFSAGVRIVVKPGLVAPRTSTDGRVISVAAGNSTRVTSLRSHQAYTFAVFSKDERGALSARATAATAAGTVLTVAASPASVVRGAITTVTGRLTKVGGAVMADRPLGLYFRASGQARWRLAATARTDTAGRLRFVSRPSTAGAYAVRFDGEPGAFGVLSPPAAVRVSASG